jgi:fumarylacetoacetase
MDHRSRLGPARRARASALAVSDTGDAGDFTFANLPFGVAGGRAYVAIGDRALDLLAAGFGDDFEGPLNRFLARGPAVWAEVRGRVAALLHDGDAARPHLVDRSSLTMELPVVVGDYVDGYAGLHHATNLGKILRPGTEPLNPNWRHLPVMYHGRTSTIVPSGTAIERPRGQVKVGDRVELQPTQQLDIELELGAIVGGGNGRGEPISVDDAPSHIFGYVLVNDWSARDIQAFEYQPLGPFLGKSFATSISPWIVPAAALEPHLVSGLAARQDPQPLEYLRGDQRVHDLRFTIDLNGERISEVSLADALYWTPAQQLAHLTINGAVARPGDLIASGTISGQDHLTQAGSLIERSWRTAFLEDGDVVTIRGWTGEGDRRVGFGALTGQVVGATTAARMS